MQKKFLIKKKKKKKILIKKTISDQKFFLIKQFKTFIILDGKYSSIYDKLEGIFLRKNAIQIFFDEIFSK